MHLGKKIKLVRIAKGYTQQELGDKVGKTRPLISSIEQTGNVNMYTLMDICKVLDLSAEDLDQVGTSQDAYFPYMGKNKNDLEELKAENKRLKEDIEILKELVDSQKEIIQFLRSQGKSNKRP